MMAARAQGRCQRLLACTQHSDFMMTQDSYCCHAGCMQRVAAAQAARSAEGSRSHHSEALAWCQAAAGLQGTRRICDCGAELHAQVSHAMTPPAWCANTWGLLEPGPSLEGTLLQELHHPKRIVSTNTWHSLNQGLSSLVLFLRLQMACHEAAAACKACMHSAASALARACSSDGYEADPRSHYAAGTGITFTKAAVSVLWVIANMWTFSSTNSCQHRITPTLCPSVAALQHHQDLACLSIMRPA